MMIVIASNTACSGKFIGRSFFLERSFSHHVITLKPFIPNYVKDRNQVLDEIKHLKLPPHALLFVTDENSMYNNIDADHVIRVIT